ncbi:MAG: hypothetical protein IMZ52_03200 [Actinobacteria bacterium]|nr:hypothetical protein [Actinomycetota bacterium]
MKGVNKLELLMIVGIIISALVLILVVFIFIPPRVSVLGIPCGFSEKQFNTGEVILNYVEGPENGVPLLLIPGQMECVPKEGRDDLLYIPAPIAKGIVNLFNINKKYRPNRTYDPPFLPFSLRALFKFLLEYDVDFSLATIDGRLSEGFDPEDALEKVKCPMLLLHASWSRHETWGLLGAMDDTDAQKIKSLVKDIRYVRIDSGHEIHMGKPKRYLEQVNSFVDGLQIDGE